MKLISRWLGTSHRRDPRDGDPYLEKLARQLLLLRSGQTPRRALYRGSAHS
jgi:hypothetical protein